MRTRVSLLIALLAIVVPTSLASMAPQRPQSAIGDQIAFVSSRNGSNEIYLINSSGGDVDRLTERGTDERDPALSPDGSKITYASNMNGDFEIYVADAVPNAEPLRITRNTGRDTDPAWSPDGSLIAFTSNRSGNREFVYVIAADGTGEPRRLTTGAEYEARPAWSPSGVLVAFGDLFGASLSSANFNGDAIDDLVVGVPGEDIGSIRTAGLINVLYGASGALSSAGDQAWHQNSRGIAGSSEAGDRLGESLAASQSGPNQAPVLPFLAAAPAAAQAPRHLLS